MDLRKNAQRRAAKRPRGPFGFLAQHLAALAPARLGYATGTLQARKNRAAMQNLSKLEDGWPLIFTSKRRFLCKINLKRNFRRVGSRHFPSVSDGHADAPRVVFVEVRPLARVSKHLRNEVIIK